MVRITGKLELWFWVVLPGLITCLLALFSLVSKHVGSLSHIMPALPLIPIFYWGLMHAREMPFWLVFVLGLVTDAASGQPPGYSSLLYILFLGLLHAQRRYIHKEGFVIKWAYFTALLAVTDLAGWAILSVYNARPLPVGPALIQWLLTAGCYPLLHKLFDQLDDLSHNRRWRILHGR